MPTVQLRTLMASQSCLSRMWRMFSRMRRTSRQTDSQADDQMKKYMAVQEGDSTKQRRTRVLQSLLSWNAAVGFSWFGTKGKKRICELLLCKLMCGVLTNDIQNPNASLKDVEKAAMTWFRHTAERLAAQQK
ncbi:uncharacterized protein LOC119392847 [Rhipicephalus sanguineus]|uniref:uncharacterized protein LOC119392847 n=1 Tax=Rhipicephalus sanguineus TaxID=34632 RepID=UPI0018930C0E|nr:uncharacterized protein LOC119392847 [Rhipicephalus sanguineus]